MSSKKNFKHPGNPGELKGIWVYHILAQATGEALRLFLALKMSIFDQQGDELKKRIVNGCDMLKPTEVATEVPTEVAAEVTRVGFWPLKGTFSRKYGGVHQIKSCMGQSRKSRDVA